MSINLKKEISKLEGIKEALQGKCDERVEKFDERSENWQESDKGEVGNETRVHAVPRRNGDRTAGEVGRCAGN